MFSKIEILLPMIYSIHFVVLILCGLAASIYYLLMKPKSKPVRARLPEKEKDIYDLDFGLLLDSKPNPEKIVFLFYNLEVDPELSSIGVPAIPIESALGCLLRLIVLVWVKERTPEQMSLLCSVDTYTDKIVEAVGKLKVALTDEGFFSAGFRDTNELTRTFEIIERDPSAAFFERAAQFSENAYARLLQFIRPIDFTRLLFLLKRSKDVAQKVNSSRFGSRAIPLLGPTGAGKSTIMHGCADSGFDEVEKFGKKVLVPANPKEFMLDVHLGNLVQSMTATTVAIPFVPSEVVGDILGRSNEVVFLVDCPGVFESRGIEQKLANGYGVMNLLRKIRHVYPVVVMSSQITSQSWGVFIELMKSLTQFVPNIQSHLNSFVYVFTHGFEHESNPKAFINSSINGKINALNPQEKANPDLVALLKDVAMKTNPVTGWKQAFLISDPRTPEVKFGDLLHTIVSGTPISRENAFTAFCDQEGIIGAQMSVELVQRILVSCSNLDGRVNFETINYYLQMIKLVGDYLEFDVFQSSYSQMIQKVLAAIRVHGVGKLESFFNALNGIEIVSKSKEEEARFINQCEELKNAQEGIFNAYEMIGNHISRYDKLTPAFFEDGMKNFIHENLILTLRNRLNNNASESLTNYILQARMERLAVAVGYFPCLHDSFEEAKTLVQDYCSNLLNKFSNIVMNPSLWDISVMVPALNDLLEASNHFSEYLDPPRKYENCKTILLKEMQKWNKQAEKVLSKLIEDQNGRETLEAISSRYYTAVCDPDFCRHFQAQLKDQHKEFTGFVKSYVEMIVRFITDAVDNLSLTKIGNVERYYNEIDTIVEVPSISNIPDVSATIYQYKVLSQAKLGSFVSILAKECDLWLEKLEMFEISPEDTKRFADRLSVLKKCHWINKFRPEDYRDVDMVKKRIEKCGLALKSAMKSITLSLDNFEDLKLLVSLKYQVTFCSDLVPEIPALEEILKCCDKIYIEKRLSILKTISSLIPQELIESGNFSVICEQEDQRKKFITLKDKEAIEEFFHLCSELLLSDLQEREISSSFDKLLDTYRQFIRYQLDNSFRRITTLERDKTPSEDGCTDNFDSEEDLKNASNDGDISVISFSTTTNDVRELNRALDQYLENESNIMFLRLTEVQQFAVNDPQFRAIADEWLLSAWEFNKPFVGLLVAKHKELENEVDNIAAEGNAQRLYSDSLICKYLSRFDSFFSADHLISFRNLRGRYVLELSKVTGDAKERIRIDWQERRFTHLKQELHKLNDPNNAISVATLNAFKLDFMEDLKQWKSTVDSDKNRLNAMNLDFMKNFANRFIDLRKARDVIGEFLDQGWIRANVSDEYFTEIRESLLKDVANYANVDAFLRHDSYSEPENRKEILEEVDRIIKGLIPQGKSSSHHSRPHDMDVVQKLIQGIEHAIEERFKYLNQLYTTTTEIHLFPVSPFHLFKVISPLFPSKVGLAYQSRWNTLKMAISNNVRTRLDEIENNKFPMTLLTIPGTNITPTNSIQKSLKERKNLLSRIESTIKSWPIDLQTAIDTSIDMTRKSLEDMENNLKDSVDRAFTTNDYSQLVRELEEAKRLGNSEILQIGKKRIESILFDIGENIRKFLNEQEQKDNNFTEGKYLSIKNDLSTLVEFQNTHLEKVLPDFITRCEQIYDSLGKLLVSKFQQFDGIFIRNPINNNMVGSNTAAPDNNSNNNNNHFNEVSSTSLLIRLDSYIYGFNLLMRLERDFPNVFDYLMNPTQKIQVKGSLSNAIKDVRENFEFFRNNFILSITTKTTEIQSTLTIYENIRSLEIFQPQLQVISSRELFHDFRNLFSLREAKELLTNALKEWLNQGKSYFNEAYEKSVNQSEKTVNYEKAFQYFSFLHLMKVNIFQIHPRKEELSKEFPFYVPEYQNLLRDLLRRITGFSEECTAILHQTGSFISNQSIEKFRNCFDHLVVIQSMELLLPSDEATTIISSVKDSIKKIDGEFQKKINVLLTSMKKIAQTLKTKHNSNNATQSIEGDLINLTNDLYELNELRRFHEIYEKEIDPKIRDIFLKDLPEAILTQLAEKLFPSPQGFEIIVRESAIFEASLNNRRKKDTSDVNFDVILTKIKKTSPDLDTNDLRVVYEDRFQRKFQKLISERNQFRGTITEYLQQHIYQAGIKSILNKRGANTFPTSNSFVTWNDATKNLALDLLPYIAAVKTLMSASCSWEIHPVQVCSLLYIFGVGKVEAVLKSVANTLGLGALTSDSILENKILEIGTGEGKSVTISFAAIIFALIGYDVKIACYSKPLISRDEEEFAKFYDFFQLSPGKIVYNTLYSLCEVFVNRSGDIRDPIVYTLQNGSLPPPPAPLATGTASSTTTAPQLLFLDEVDMLLQPQFSSDTYNVNANWKDQTITELITAIYMKKPSSLIEVKQFPEYSTCQKKYINWQFFLDQEIRKMISSLVKVLEKKSKPHHFNTNTNEIGYAMDDDINYKYTVDYQTMFLYFKEYEERKLSLDIVRQQYTWINVTAGSFLYCEFIKEFAGIISVTGSYDTLIPDQKKILKKLLNAQQEILIPSAYGDRDGRFLFSEIGKSDILLIDDDIEFYTAIDQEISRRLKSNRDVKDLGHRAVIVMMENSTAIKNFHAYYSSHIPTGCRLQTLYAHDSKSERKNKIALAVTPGMITLADKVYGRGTDFISNDATLNNRGGVHILQTFYSFEKSEEKQIQGRTARSKNQGSYSLILLKSDLLKLFDDKHLFTAEIFKQMKASDTRYQTLNDLRLKKCQEMVNQLIVTEDLMKLHKESIKLRDSLSVEVLKNYLTYLIQRNGSKNSKNCMKNVSFGIDYSGSMSGLKITSARTSLTKIFHQYIYDHDRIGLIKFHSRVEEIQSLVFKNQDEEGIYRKIQSLTSPTGGTAIYDAIAHSLKMLKALHSPPAAAPAAPAAPAAIAAGNNNSTIVESSDWIVILTDGDDGSSQINLDQICQQVAASPDVGVFIIGVGNDFKRDVMQRIVSSSPKGALVLAGGDQSSLDNAFNQVIEIIEGQGSFNR